MRSPLGSGVPGRYGAERGRLCRRLAVGERGRLRSWDRRAALHQYGRRSWGAGCRQYDDYRRSVRADGRGPDGRGLRHRLVRPGGRRLFRLLPALRRRRSAGRGRNADRRDGVFRIAQTGVGGAGGGRARRDLESAGEQCDIADRCIPAPLQRGGGAAGGRAAAPGCEAGRAERSGPLFPRRWSPRARLDRARRRSGGDMGAGLRRQRRPRRDNLSRQRRNRESPALPSSLAPGRWGAEAGRTYVAL